MDSTRTPATFAEMAEELGIRRRLMYPVSIVARVVGVPASTIWDEMAAGRMRYVLPEGRSKGKMVRPEWVDQWIEEGTV